MRVDHAKGCILSVQVHEDARQRGVLDDVGKVSGVKGVTIIHPVPSWRTKSVPEMPERGVR
jgi:hypothetical protein